MATLNIEDLTDRNDLDRPAMSAIRGGFWNWFGLGFKSLVEGPGEEECNNGICVPYQDEDGNY